MTGTLRIDEPSSRCAFDSNGCSVAMNGHGGFDVHHRWPKEMGGPDHQPDELQLCPNHHHRQHALIRYLVEQMIGDRPTTRKVLGHFAPVERQTALYALTCWINAGKPSLPGWSVPAAR